jgi:uncharacterized membrane protein YphA (DoxX/SURF4 family)
MEKQKDFFQLYLRLAIGIGYLVPSLDRLGVWGPPGGKNISWGDWQHFMEFAGQVMDFLPLPLISLLAVVATIAEIVFGLLLLVGKWTKISALASGLLTFLFAVSMAISFGIVSPLSYSVFTVSAASFLLSTVGHYKWSLDEMAYSK